MRLLRDVGASCNLVMFQPMPPAIADAMSAACGMCGLIEQLRNREAVRAIRWLW